MFDNFYKVLLQYRQPAMIRWHHQCCHLSTTGGTVPVQWGASSSSAGVHSGGRGTPKDNRQPPLTFSAP